jgi:uncharacterized membrane protein YdjX (TVP38/TMEM64 family)
MRGLDEANLGEDDPLKPFSQRPQLRRRLIVFSLLFGAVTLVLMVQGFDPHSQTRRFLATLIQDVQDPRWGVLYVLLSFAVGTLMFAPITAMFVATSLVLSPLYGFFYCLLGGLFGGSLAYAIGRLLGARLLSRFRGAHLARLAREVEKRPLRSVLLARFLPVGNFTLINLLLGSLHVPYRAFAGGTLLGMLPGVLGITLCKGLLERVWRAPSAGNIALLVLGLVAVAISLYAVARGVARRRRSRVELERAEALQADLSPD